MRGVAAYIMKGRAQAVAAVCAFTVLSWIVSLASLLSAAAVALPTLRNGAVEGALIMGAASLGVAAAGAMVYGSPAPAGYALALWLPVWLLALLLRQSGRLAWALTVAAGLGMALVLAIYLASGDPAKMWLEELRLLAKPWLERQGSTPEAAMLMQNFELFARYMTGSIAAGWMLTLSLGLFVARWWQSLLFNPGGFRAEFLELRASTAMANPWLALLALAWLSDGVGAEVAVNLVIALSTLFLLCGLAVLHAAFSGSANGGFWLTGMYMALIFVSPLLVLIMLIGCSDAWIDWRRRFRPA
jgi:hypothetical protein